MSVNNSRLHWPFTAARLGLCLILVVTITASITTPVRAAGLLTHAEVVEQAIGLVDEQAYPELADFLNEYRGVVTYGSLFPDWAFTIPGSNLTELAHDSCGQPPCPFTFRNALAAYLLPAFRNPQSEEDRKAVAFLLGVIAHQEIDNPWHFTKPGGPLAFEPACGNQNPKLGLMCEFLTEFPVGRYLIGFKHTPEFWFPEEALMAAGKVVAGDTLSVNEFRLSKNRQSVLFYTEILASYFLLPGYSLITSLPYLTIVENYPSGGLKDGAEHTADTWQHMWSWLNSYSPVTSISLSLAQPEGSNDGDRQSVEITLTASDNFDGWVNTGPFMTLYSLDGAEPQVYSGPLMVSSVGIHTITFYSIDSMGNSEDPQPPLTITIPQTNE